MNASGSRPLGKINFLHCSIRFSRSLRACHSLQRQSSKDCLKCQANLEVFQKWWWGVFDSNEGTSEEDVIYSHSELPLSQLPILKATRRSFCVSDYKFQCNRIAECAFEILGKSHFPSPAWTTWLRCPLRVGLRLAIDGTDSAESVVLDGNRFSPVDPALHP